MNRKVLLVYANPNPKAFNHSIFESLQKGLRTSGHEVKVKNLYAEAFNPVLDFKDYNALKEGSTPADILREQECIDWADGLIFVYPLWWFDRPAILKGWIDRVFAYGYAYGPKEDGSMSGLLKIKRAWAFQTAGELESSFMKFGGRAAIETPMLDGTLKYCGIANSEMFSYFALGQKTGEERNEILESIEKMASDF